MRKYTIGAVTGVKVSYYYSIMRPSGSWDSGYHYEGTTGPVAQRYMDDVQSKSSTLKPWYTSWESLGYPLIDKLIEENPDAYPNSDHYPLVVVKDPSIKNREFRKRQLEGEILVSNLSKQTFDVKYTRGTVISDNVLRDLGYKNGNSSLVRVGDVFTVGNGQMIKIMTQPSLFYRYGLKEAKTEVHPFDVGWDRHAALLPSFEYNNRLITSVLAEAESGTYDILTEMAELPETVGFLADTIKKGTKSIETYQREILHYKNLLKNATGKFAEKIAKKLASAWMAYRYAIMPILYSIEDLKKTLKEYKRIFAKFRSGERFQLDFPVENFTQTSFASGHDRCWIKRSYSPEDLVDQLLGVLKFNPLSTAWELVTLSFVVDWFVNVGDVITAFSGNKAYIDQGAVTSRKIEGTSTYQSKLVSTCKVDILYASYDRHVIEPRDYISLSFEFDMNWKRWLDSIALSLQPTIKTLKRIQRNA